MSNPVDAQLVFESGYGIARLGGSLVSVSGPDRISWLTTLSSQLLIEVPFESQELLFLDPQGRIRFACGAVDDGSTTWLYGFTGQGQELAEFLNSMRFMLRVQVQDHSAEVDIYGYLRTGGYQLLEAALQDTYPSWQDPWPNIQSGGTSYTERDFRHPGLTYPMALVAVKKTEKNRVENVISEWAQKGSWPLETELGYRLSGPAMVAESVWRMVQIKALRPTMYEVDGRSLPHELDWLRTAVHLHKGCYCGQETVARIVNLGRPPRALAFAHLDGSTNDLPSKSAIIKAGSREVGVLLNAGRDYELGPVGMALVKKNAFRLTELHAEWEAEGELLSVPVQLVRITADSGKSWDSPAERPGMELRSAGRSGGSIPGGLLK